MTHACKVHNHSKNCHVVSGDIIAQLLLCETYFSARPTMGAAAVTSRDYLVIADGSPM
jgi:hypothetical protein